MAVGYLLLALTKNKYSHRNHNFCIIFVYFTNNWHRYFISDIR